MVLNPRSAYQLSAIALAVGFSPLAGAQGPGPPASNAVLKSEKEANRITFSIDDAKEINHQLRWQDIAVSESRRILELRLDSKLDDPGGWKADAAAKLLGRLRVSDQDVPDLLCKNLTMCPELVGGSVAWPDTYASAMALIHIGGPRVANSVIKYLKQPRSESELLLCAQILHRNDLPEITFVRFQMATAEAKPIMTPEAHEVFARNLNQIKGWLSDPRFAYDRRYSPLKLTPDRKNE
jgi:hypothetical protein